MRVYERKIKETEQVKKELLESRSNERWKK